MRRWERDTLQGRAPEGWNYPLLSAMSLLLNEYGNNKEWQKQIGEVEYAFADGGLATDGTCIRQSGNEGVIGTWGVVLMGAGPDVAIARARGDDPNLVKHTASGLCFLPQFESKIYPGITNNQAELYAAMACMAHLPPGWGGTLVLDSHITKERIAYPNKPMTNVGKGDRMVLKMMVDRMDCDVVLVPGHQKGDDVLTFGNNLADQLATEAGQEYVQKVENDVWKSVCKHDLYRKGG